MPELFDVGKVAGDLVGAVGDAADDLFTSDEEREKWETKKAKLQQQIQKRLLGLKETLIEKRGDAVKAEIEGESWLQRSWRPLVMLLMTGLIGAYWLGVTPDLPQYAVERMYGLVKLGLGGYVIGRSAEKITRTGMDKWQKGQAGKKKR